MNHTIKIKKNETIVENENWKVIIPNGYNKNEIFVKAEKNIRYYSEYTSKMRDTKTRDNKKNISKKISDVMKYIEETDITVFEYLHNGTNNINNNIKDKGIEAYSYLEYLKNGLSNNHFTKRQSYQDFLYRMNRFLESKLDKEGKRFSKRKIVVTIQHPTLTGT